MKPSKQILALLLFAAALSTGVAGCDESQDIKNWVDNTAKLKASALAQTEVTPYRNEQQQAFKTYFVELGNMALALKNDSKLRDRFNTAFGQVDAGVTCEKVLILKYQWSRIMENCTRNRFFLCSEEVRAYPDFVSALRQGLNLEQQRRFDQADKCREAL